MDSHRIEENIRASARFTFARSGGPGGQNVNKVSSKAILRLPLGRFAGLAGLTDAELVRIREKLGRRLNERGDLVLTVQDTRDQAKNRETRPSTGSREARLASKKRRGVSKRLRSSRPEED
jgi:ribosome-associated protein